MSFSFTLARMKTLPREHGGDVMLQELPNENALQNDDSSSDSFSSHSSFVMLIHPCLRIRRLFEGDESRHISLLTLSLQMRQD